MNTERLVLAVRRRAANEATRTDISGSKPQGPFDVTDPGAIARAERELQFQLPELLASLYLQVGNGGFGPGYGIFGLRGGHADADGRTIEQIYPAVQEAVTWHLKVASRRFLPICDWGSGVVSCLDCESIDVPVLTWDEYGFTRTRFTFESWLESWVAGQSIWDEMYDFKQVEGKNPFTKEPMTLKSRGLPRGERLV